MIFNKKGSFGVLNDLAKEIESEFVETHPVLLRKQIENALFNRDER